jgi:SSS family solute:Na+ symporter
MAGVVADGLEIGAYMALMLYMGWRSRRQDAHSYWVANRNNSTVGIAMSLVATIFGASSTMGIIGMGYQRGLTAAWWALIGGIALIPCAFFLAERVRARKALTLPDILQEAYGEKVAFVAGLTIAVAWCGVIAAQMIAGGRLISGFFGIDLGLATGAVAAAFTLYTLWGGQLSVIRTDAWQIFIFLAGLAVGLYFLWSAAYPPTSGGGAIPPGHLSFPVGQGFGWYDVLVFYPLIVGLPYLVGPDIYSRIFCAKDGLTARKAVFISGIAIVPIAFALALFGILARAALPGIAPEAALSKAVSAFVPVGLKGLIIAGFLAAVMSSADTCLISASTILSLNVVRPIKDLGEAGNYRLTKVLVLVLGLVSWFIASRQAGIIASLLLAYSVFVGGVVFPTLFALFNNKLRIKPGAALLSVISGGGLALLTKINGGAVFKGIVQPQYFAILPLVVSVAILWGGRERK